MATGEQFRAASAKLRHAAESAGAAEFRATTASYAVAVVGGELEALIDRALIAAQVMAADLEARCTAAEAECVERAVVCESYAAQYVHWQAQRADWADQEYAASVSDGRLPDPGPPPVAPTRPASWVDLP